MSGLLTDPIAGAYFTLPGPQVGEAFLNFYNRNGGLGTFGLALSEQMQENGRTVQYFERQRFEYHPENVGTGNEVQLGLLGISAAGGKGSRDRIAPFQSGPGRIYVPETGHSLSNAFLDFWRAHSGVQLLGYPISEPARENGLIVQYFERARMEFHLEGVPNGFAVQLGLLGADYMLTHPEVRAAIGATSVSRQAVTVAAQKLAPPGGGSQVANFAQELFNRVNSARTAAGLRPVAYSGAVAGAALYRSNDMAARGYFSHDVPGGNTFLTLLKRALGSFHFAGEIIAWNNYSQGQTSLVAFNDFMKSPHHHDIIMDPRYSMAGAGVAKAGNGRYYYTVLFVEP